MSQVPPSSELQISVSCVCFFSQPQYEVEAGQDKVPTEDGIFLSSMSMAPNTNAFCIYQEYETPA
jgi:hypothetical protein